MADGTDRITITNINVYDGVSDELATNQVVAVAGDTIDRITPGPADPVAYGLVIDGGGRTLMPGLIDCHVHLTHALDGGITGFEATTWDEIGSVAAYAAREHLMAGFTTVRDAGGLGSGLRKVIDRGLLPGPRIYPSGAYISQTSGHGDLRLASQTRGIESNLQRLGIIHLADGADQVRAAVREQLSRGATQVKLMVGGGVSSDKDPLASRQYTSDEIAAAVESADAWGTYVLVHVYHDEYVRRALELGVKSIEHGHFITAETAQMIKDAGAFQSLNLAGLSPALFRHPVYGAEGSPQRIKSEAFQEQSKDLIDIVKDVGHNVVFNTDLVFNHGPGFRAAIDFAKWIQGDFFGNAAALRAMTSTPGELVAQTGMSNPYPGRLGVIEAGAYADLLLVDGNPLEDLGVIGADSRWFDQPPRDEDIPTLRLIMKGGQIYKNTLDRPV